MTIRLVIHLEALPDRPVWWAESPDVPGFSATEDTLGKLLNRAQWALDAELGKPFQLEYELASDPQSDLDLEIQVTGFSEQLPKAEASSEIQAVTRGTDRTLAPV
jgi:predicted RNase H-like HicB family nuclease